MAEAADPLAPLAPRDEAELRSAQAVVTLGVVVRRAAAREPADQQGREAEVGRRAVAVAVAVQRPADKVPAPAAGSMRVAAQVARAPAVQRSTPRARATSIEMRDSLASRRTAPCDAC